jgi:hypothetical protein
LINFVLIKSKDSNNTEFESASLTYRIENVLDSLNCRFEPLLKTRLSVIDISMFFDKMSLLATVPIYPGTLGSTTHTQVEAILNV